jgi:pSer/pThr/pTyr-binding forkhead associated (FHA) protein
MDTDNNEISETFIESQETPAAVHSRNYFAVSGDGVPQKLLRYNLSKDVTIIGRDESCDLTLNDPKISRKHLKVVVEGESNVRIMDMGSSNGTFINDVRVDNRVLKYGDEVAVGNTLLKYLYTDDDKPSAKKVYELS